MNYDGQVRSADLNAVRANWLQSVEPGSLEDGDADGNGVVDADDLDIVRANWGRRLGDPVSVPEPSIWGLLLAVATIGIRRRRTG